MRRDMLVYGTLRPGGVNPTLVDIAEEVVPNVEVSGLMRNRWGDTPCYPVVDFSEPGRVVGDVLIGLDDDDPAVRRIDAMEVRAGYQLLELHVPHFGIVTVYNFPLHPCWDVGPVVPGGDWLAWCEWERTLQLFE